jgi:release factor glutamine methyltransferase
VKIKELYIKGLRELRDSDVSEPEASAQFLLREVLGFTKEKYMASLEEPISLQAVKKYKEYIEKRKRHQPVWQIVGKVEFWNMEFFVDNNVLVPRPETEFLVEGVLEIIKKKFSEQDKLKIVDIGTGSGPIAISIKKELPLAQVFASDISAAALKVAQSNANHNNAEVAFKEGPLFVPWKGQKFDVICANLPYIPTEEMASLSMDVHHYEPRIALEGGPGGLVIYKEFLKMAPSFINKGGFLACEIGAGQGREFADLVEQYFLGASCKIRSDLANLDRIAFIELSG